MRAFRYVAATDVGTILGSLAPHTRAYAGGTDLLPRMKANIDAPQQLIDIKRANLPCGVEVHDSGVRIGALATLRELEEHPELVRLHPLLARALERIATPQLRNRATLAGNLVQRPRCWYYRSEHVRCWLKGGDECPAVSGRNELHAVFGDGPCRAVHPSDLAPCLIALDARVRIDGPQGVRTLPLEELYAAPDTDRRHETLLSSRELILEVEIPVVSSDTDVRSTYLKAMDRKIWAFALVGVAVVLTLEGERIRDARIVLGGVANVPRRAHQAERALIGHVASGERIAQCADACVAGAQPLARNGYKVELTRRLVTRALCELTSATAQS